MKITHRKNILIRKKLEDVLEISSTSLWRYTTQNKWNGVLTTEAALNIMEDELKMKRCALLESHEVD